MLKTIAIPLIGALVTLGACAQIPSDTTAPLISTPVPTTPKIAQQPATFTTSNLTIRPYTVETANQTEVGVTVTNTGGEEGTYTVVLKIDGIVTARQDITLAGGTSENVVFTVPIISTLDNHVVTIDNLTGDLLAPDPDAH